jgi:hypothetical protein
MSDREHPSLPPSPLATPATAATKSTGEATKTQPAPAVTSGPSPTPLSSPSLRQCGVVSSPDSSPEKLDWGSIDDEDDAFALCSSLPGASVKDVAFTASAGQPSSSGQPVQLLSRNKTLHSEAGKTEAPAKLKSVIVVPGRHSEAGRMERHQDGGQQGGEDLSQEWTAVKPRKGSRAAEHSSSVGPLLRCQRASQGRAQDRQTSLEYKKRFKGKCFRCLASDHQVALCREPFRCFNCRGVWPPSPPLLGTAEQEAFHPNSPHLCKAEHSLPPDFPSKLRPQSHRFSVTHLRRRSFLHPTYLDGHR